MRPIIFLLCFSVVLAGCTKDKFTTKPQLKIKDFTSEVTGNEILQFNIRLTDKEGDFSPFFGYKKTVINCAASNFTDTTKLQIPSDFIDAKLKEGEIVIYMDKLVRGDNQCAGPGGLPKTDTAVFRFWTKDKAGNISDTAVSEPIIIH